jgi:hypothetical protein
VLLLLLLLLLLHNMLHPLSGRLDRERIMQRMARGTAGTRVDL